jgi:hypothetical protein
MWSAFALWAATVWDRMPRSLHLAGTGAIALCGVLVGAVAWVSLRAIDQDGSKVGTNTEFVSAWHALQDIAISTWQTLWPMALIVSASLFIFGALALYLIATERTKLAATVIAAAMVPTGLSMIDGVTRVAPYFSLANAARFLNERLTDKGEVIYEGALHRGSSLVFYLNRKFFLVNRPQNDDSFVSSHQNGVVLTEEDALEKWSAPGDVYLIIEQRRVGYWKNLLVERFHIYHQVTTCGTHVVLSNQM